MLKIFGLILILIIFWFLLYELFYSPKAQIKRLWKKIHKLDSSLNKIRNSLKKDDGEDSSLWTYSSIGSSFDEEKDKKGTLINALIENELDKNKDSEFIKKYYYKNN